jgi:uncharacterized membrane protein YedE/YeeE
MIVSIATLLLGFVIGYLGQRSRLCFISGYRDFFLTRNTALLRGVAGAFLGALGGYILFSHLGGTIPEFPIFAHAGIANFSSEWLIMLVGGIGVGVVGVLSGGCPYRMHVLAAEGRKSQWFYLLGFYLGLVFYNLVTVHLMVMIRALL